MASVRPSAGFDWDGLRTGTGSEQVLVMDLRPMTGLELGRVWNLFGFGADMEKC